MALATALDWGALAPLRLRARGTALGALAGSHRSARRGAGVEFAGHRAYTPGDDLRFLDRHALVRHGALVLREFETETERTLSLLVNATASMSFRGARAPGAKLAFAALVAAALGYVALRNGDRVRLDWLGGEGLPPLDPRGGSHGFEHLLDTLEGAAASGELDLAVLDRALSTAGRTRTGTITVLLSDLLDLPAEAPDRVAALGGPGRALLVVQVLDDEEIELPFDGPVRLRSLEGDVVVDTDAPRVRAAYKAELEKLRARWARALANRAGELVTASTSDDPVEVVRRALFALGGRVR